MKDFRNGDRSAFDLLVARYKHDLFQFILSKVKNRDLASDLTQDVFVKIYKSVESYSAAGKFKAWIFRIAQNVCFDEFRRQKKASILSIHSEVNSEKTDYPDHENTIQESSANPAEEFEHLELQTIIESALNTIPENQRTALVLCQYHGMSYQEIADIQKCPLGTVKSRVHNALLKMKEILQSSDII
ncbi:MAG: RNA polymerase sigma factor [Candidatus Zhuqueibacterota bacterium]